MLSKKFKTLSLTLAKNVSLQSVNFSVCGKVGEEKKCVNFSVSGDTFHENKTLVMLRDKELSRWSFNFTDTHSQEVSREGGDSYNSLTLIEYNYVCVLYKHEGWVSILCVYLSQFTPLTSMNENR